MAPRASLPTASKKRKHAGEGSATSDVAASIKSLEDQLIAAVSSKSSLNPLADLLDIARSASDPGTLSKAIYALYRVFVVIISNSLLLSVAGSDETKAVRVWLQEKLHSYVELLIGLLKDEESVLKTSSLKILLSLQKHLSTMVSKAPGSSSASRPQFYMSHFRQVVRALLICPPSPRAVHKTKKPKSDAGAEDGMLDAEVRDMFMEQWLSECDDIRWFFLRESAGLLATYSREDHPHVPENLLSLLERLTTFPTEAAELNTWWVEELGAKPPKPKAQKNGDAEQDGDEEPKAPDAEEDEDVEDDWRKFFDEDQNKQDASAETKATGARLHKLSIHQSLHSLSSHRAVFTRTWLTLLPQLSTGPEESSKALATRALNVMHRGVMPHLTRAVMVMDWISSCVDYGGTVGLLALNALFILMKEYNLDYPAFYTRLYSFLDRNVLHLKHRARFFRMTELFLSSTHLPVNLLASFVKRLARLSLSAPPAAIVMILPLTYNILKKHPALMVMIHRVDDSYEATEDPFDTAEPNPTLTNAIDSSLWELHTHREHYHSAVSTLARIFAEAFTKPNYSLEDFLDHTYSTLYETEAKRRIKKEPAIAMDVPQRQWFPAGHATVDEGGDAAEAEADRVTALWSFS
ncbi:CBF/MAK21 family protein [Phanerochaete sordida]|uniref:CBF/MAK21 family protein n=1 Tax=Phanerochaete sordida TaxID=48140 RepID=A0A9P3GAJ6_9APHY|nr:CBF/MAK21 family protein [Phanerochaete sordida]